MRKLFFLTSIAVLGATAVAPASAQGVPNLSGTWVLQVDKSDFGAVPAPQSRTDVITHQEPKFTIKRTVAGNGGQTVLDLVYAVDGKPYKNSVNGSELTSTLRWDGQTLVMASTLALPQGEVTITDRFTLSADGKTLTQDRTLSQQGQSTEQKLVLVKQP
jgi:hypothetical protein